ncbi:DUF664 domain-containing protein [Lapillicoccus sp.]|uniref:mycothiol transferase n=1 Tax=Lapillicoccus sp. TaxID=1909287 RepID=UPI0032660679
MSAATPVPSHVNLVVTDIARSVEFYRLLGWDVDADTGPHATVRFPSQAAGLMVDLDQQEFARDWNRGAPPSVTGGSAVVVMRVPDRAEVDESHNRLVDGGYASRQLPYDAFWGARFAVVADPDGYQIGLMSPVDEASKSWPPTPAPLPEPTETARPVIPEGNFSPTWSGDTRKPLPQAGGERDVLTAYLDYHRATFELKCGGLDSGQLSERSMPPSTMSLHGLLRHLTGGERWWMQINFAGDDVPMLYYSDDDPDQDFDSLDGDVAEAFELWRRECQRSREIVAAHDLDDTGTRVRDGEPISLRGVIMKMIAEYAQHNGHADLLREGIDGRTGA